MGGVLPAQGPFRVFSNPIKHSPRASVTGPRYQRATVQSGGGGDGGSPATCGPPAAARAGRWVGGFRLARGRGLTWWGGRWRRVCRGVVGGGPRAWRKERGQVGDGGAALGARRWGRRAVHPGEGRPGGLGLPRKLRLGRPFRTDGRPHRIASDRSKVRVALVKRSSVCGGEWPGAPGPWRLRGNNVRSGRDTSDGGGVMQRKHGAGCFLGGTARPIPLRPRRAPAGHGAARRGAAPRGGAGRGWVCSSARAARGGCLCVRWVGWGAAREGRPPTAATRGSHQQPIGRGGRSKRARARRGGAPGVATVQ